MLITDIVTKQVVLANREYLYHNTFEYIKNGKPTTMTGHDLINGFLGISYVINDSAAFGIGLNNPVATRIMYIIVTTIISAVLVFFYIKSYKKLGKYVKSTMMLILAGAIGNLIDRIFYSGSTIAVSGASLPNNGVVDWINFYGIWQYNFNWADSCLVVGVFMLIIYLIVTEIIDWKKSQKDKPKLEKGEKVLSKEEQSRLEASIREEEKTENKENNE